MTRIDLVRLVAALILVALLVAGSRKLALVPKRAGQKFFEFSMGFVYEQFAVSNLGPKLGRKYFPMLATMFFAIFALNITDVVPFMNVPSNALVAVPLIFAVVSWIAFVSAGVKEHSLGGFLKDELVPKDTPIAILPLLSLLEFFSTFIVRPVTLTVRLMANMMAGFFLLLAFSTMTSYLLLDAAGALKPVAILSFTALVAFTALEIFICALQAYIFTLLSSVYISLAVRHN
jgi:F-type H+-transporting ATPase subunit a